jgi:hypothetical protein
MDGLDVVKLLSRRDRLRHDHVCVDPGANSVANSSVSGLDATSEGLLGTGPVSAARRGYDGPMNSVAEEPSPSGHTPEGGVLVGSEGARRRLVVFEDLQCPYCREFEEVSGDLLRREVAAGSVAVEYRIRSFLGPESVRAANALAAAAEAGHFNQLRRELFAAQPAENSGGFTAEDLLESGRRAGLTGQEYATAVREGRYEQWVLRHERVFREGDPTGTPAALLDGELLDSRTLLNPDALGAAIRSYAHGDLP